MNKVPVGLQLYSVRHALAEDPRGTLAAVAEMGYSGVEFFGAPRYAADELRGLLDETGLVCCGWHTPIELLQESTIYPTIAYHKALGNDKLIVPWVHPEQYKSRADWIGLAEFLSRTADVLAHYDMATGFHNHYVEFHPVEGEWPWYTLFDHAGPGVIMQFDTGNALTGNPDVDLVEVVRRYPGQSRSVHLKPFAKSLAAQDLKAATRPVIGEDEVPWPDFFAACEGVGGVEWYIVEYESDAHPPLEAVQRCLQALRAMGK